MSLRLRLCLFICITYAIHQHADPIEWTMACPCFGLAITKEHTSCTKLATGLTDGAPVSISYERSLPTLASVLFSFPENHPTARSPSHMLARHALNPEAFRSRKATSNLLDHHWVYNMCQQGHRTLGYVKSPPQAQGQGEWLVCTTDPCLGARGAWKWT